MTKSEIIKGEDLDIIKFKHGSHYECTKNFVVLKKLCYML